MAPKNSKKQKPRTVEGADPSVDFRDLTIPRDEVNTSEGCEYLDGSIRMEEQPLWEDVRPKE